MRSKNIDIYYFSGTGNTLLIARKMAEVFRVNGCKVKMSPIERSDPAKLDPDNTIGLAFPVAVFSTYKFVWDFIRALPRSNGTEVFMVDTLMGFSGGIIGPLKRLLVSKGYSPIGAKEIMMPNNFYPIRISREKDRKKVMRGMMEAEKYALDLIKGKAQWKRLPILSDLFYYIIGNDYVWGSIGRWGKSHKVDHDKCDKCGICVKLCPVKNLKIEKRLTVGDKCQQCVRCVMFCPKKAITMPIWKYKTYNSVPASDIIAGGI